MRIRFSLQPHPGNPVTDVVFDGPDSAVIADLGTALRRDFRRLLPQLSAMAPLAEGPLLEGGILPPPPPAEPKPGTPRLEIVGGPYSGERVVLPEGQRLTVGSSAAAFLRIIDPGLHDLHAILEIPGSDATQKLRIRPLAGAPLWVNGVLETQARDCDERDYIRIGATVLRWGITPEPDADTAAGPPGFIVFNRASRIGPEARTPRLRLPGPPPPPPETVPLPWVSALVPTLLGVAATLVFQRPIMLLFALASPIMLLGSVITGRRTRNRAAWHAHTVHQREVHAARGALSRLIISHRSAAWHNRLDPVRIEDTARGPLAELWDRRAADPDMLEARIGLGEEDLDARLDASGSEAPQDRQIPGVSPVPITMDLAAGITAIAGPAPVARSLARAMLLHLAVRCSPRDLRIVLLCPEDSAVDWSWIRWLPHNSGAETTARLIGNTAESRRERLSELSALLGERERAGREQPPHPRILVVLDSARTYRTLPGMAELLTRGPRLGIMVLALDHSPARLPEETSAQIRVHRSDPTIGMLLAKNHIKPVILLDGASPERAEKIARALAPLRHLRATSELPAPKSVLRGVDLHGTESTHPASILDRWPETPRDLRTVIGHDARGPVVLDLVAEGPHALLAGTTGSGKSELLRGLLIGLALGYRPDTVNFILVDYKGGSAFHDLRNLPHTVGVVTNLEPQHARRALRSLEAEIRRRERVLLELGAPDLDSAWARDPDAARRAGLTRMLLAIDEFAELKTDLPEFLTGLIRIARVGRSLGFHLILATQRPAGSITPEIQANTALRIALRVTDTAESVELIGGPEAAGISAHTPGRGFVRRAPGLPPIPFQAASVSGVAPADRPRQHSTPRAQRISWSMLGRPLRFPPEIPEPSASNSLGTELHAMISAIGEAAACAAIPRSPTPWRPSLPAILALDQIPDTAVSASALTLVLGLQDRPDQQTQPPLLWNLHRDTHLALIGGARSGRATTLRVIAAQCAAFFSPRSVHLYVIDGGRGALARLSRVPHTGAVIQATEYPRLDAFLDRLLAEMRDRQHRRSRPAEAIPEILLLIEGWERVLADLTPDRALRMRERLSRLLQAGPAVRIHVVISADRTFLTDRLLPLIPTRYLFPLADKHDYITAGVRAQEIPDRVPAGRVFAADPPVEAQMAVLPSLGNAGHPEDQRQHFHEIIERSIRRWSFIGPEAAHATPFPVANLPRRMTLSEARAFPLNPGQAPRAPILGVGGPEPSRFMLTPRPGGGLLLAGGPGTGKSTALLSLAIQQSSRHPPLIIAPRAGGLRDYARAHNLPMIADPHITRAEASTYLPENVHTRSLVVLIDDLELITGTAIQDVLLSSSTALHLVGAVSLEQLSVHGAGLITEIRRARTGILFSPTRAHHGLAAFQVEPPESLLGHSEPGRGILFSEGRYVAIQVPIPVDGESGPGPPGAPIG